MNKVLVPIFLILVTVGISLTTVWQMGGFSQPEIQTPEEQRQELVNLLSSGALNDAIEASGGIATFLRDGENDSSLLLAELSNEDIRDEMKQYTRQVAIRLSQLMNEEEVKDFRGVASLEQNVLDSFSEGLLRVNVFEQVVLGILTKDSVLLSLSHFRLAEIPPGFEDVSFIEVVLLPDLLVEDSWMNEELFDGSVIDLLTSEHRIDVDTLLISLDRPDDKMILNPLNYSYEQVASQGVDPLDKVLYLRPVRGIVSFATGNVLNASSEQGIFTIGGQFRAEDTGSPVFVLNDGQIQWTGVIIFQEGDRATVLDVQALRAREEK